MEGWTTERVLALAPDAASAAAGQGLSAVSKWESMGRSARAAWGLCRGSGKSPYQTRVDLSETAFKCSCPSRKFPCKHGLGLMLVLAKEPDALPEAPEPAWVAEWLDGRTERAEKRAERTSQKRESAPDPVARAVRDAQRTGRVEAGVATCRTWLDDLVRRGLAAARGDSAAEWERTAAWMVDAQAAGLAFMIRRIPEVMSSGPGWEARTADWLGRLHLLLEAWGRRATLPPELAETVRAAIGWNMPKEEVLAGAGVVDRWMVVGQAEESNDRIRSRRTWLVGRSTAQRALLLDFAAGTQPFDGAFTPGTEFEGEIVFYPGVLALRGLVKAREGPAPLGRGPREAFDGTISEGLERYARALGANPWLSHWPLCLESVHPARAGGEWRLADRDGRTLPLLPSFSSSMPFWRWLSLTGARPSTLVVEWNGEHACPLAALAGESLIELATRWAA